MTQPSLAMSSKMIFRGLMACLLFSLSCIELHSQDDSISDSKEGFSFKDLPIEYFGSISTRHGVRFQDDPYHSKRTVLNESRLRLGMDIWFDWGEVKLKNDFIYDFHQEKYVNDLRQANILLTPWDKLDIKVGRQILTWGKGDMLFVNDLFPKDWQAFFIGREIEFLKGTSDALKLSFYFPWFELNTIYVPRFNPDRHPDATYLSYFNPFKGSFVGDVNADEYEVPEQWFSADEFHLRIRKSVKDIDVALYGYHGFWKSPAGLNAVNGKFTFPKLTEVGFSLETSIKGGVASMEYGYFRSGDDVEGTNPTIRNSQTVFLIGYSYDFKNDLKMGFQYYAELMHQYDEMLSTLPQGATPPDQWHDFITWRLTKLLDKQKFELSSFVYYSVTDNDVYCRFNSSYKLNDDLKIDLGINYFEGKDEFTFWSQFQNNNNVYIGLKRSL